MKSPTITPPPYPSPLQNDLFLGEKLGDIFLIRIRHKRPSNYQHDRTHIPLLFHSSFTGSASIPQSSYLPLPLPSLHRSHLVFGLLPVIKLVVKANVVLWLQVPLSGQGAGLGWTDCAFSPASFPCRPGDVERRPGTLDGGTGDAEGTARLPI